MLFLKHSVSTFLQPGGCDAEKHKNKTRVTGAEAVAQGVKASPLFFSFFEVVLQNALTCAEITLLVLTVVTLLCTQEYFTRRAPPTFEDDS